MIITVMVATRLTDWTLVHLGHCKCLLAIACYCLYYLFFLLSDEIKVCINSMCYLCLVSIALWYITYGIDILYVNVTMYLFMLLRIGLKPNLT